MKKKIIKINIVDIVDERKAFNFHFRSQNLNNRSGLKVKLCINCCIQVREGCFFYIGATYVQIYLQLWCKNIINTSKLRLFMFAYVLWDATLENVILFLEQCVVFLCSKRLTLLIILLKNACNDQREI